MTHPTDAAVVDFLRHATDETLAEHLEQCSACGRRAETWREILRGLTELETERVDSGELHRLLALYRCRGPAPGGVRQWLATLVRSSATAAAALRGHAETVVQEHRAGPFQIILAIRPDQRDGFRVRGQIIDDEDQSTAGDAVLSANSGRTIEAAIDEFGEFALGEVPTGRHRLLLAMARTRVVIDGIDVGGEGADADSTSEDCSPPS